jgi:plasmid maintenance system killer protein
VSVIVQAPVPLPAVSYLAAATACAKGANADISRVPSDHDDRRRFAADRAGQHSIRVNDQWRICFAWREGDAYEVEITDHHWARES